MQVIPNHYRHRFVRKSLPIMNHNPVCQTGSQSSKQKIFTTMKITTVLLLCTCVTVSASVAAGVKALSGNNAGTFSNTTYSTVSSNNVLNMPNALKPSDIITGTVKDAQGNSLAGVSVIVKGN